MSIHHKLAGSRARLRDAKDEYERVRAFAEQRAIVGLNGTIGKNEEERKRNLTIALADDKEYQAALKTLREWETVVDRLEADLEDARDRRRDHEWKIRSKLADALWRCGIESNSDDPPGDVAFDDTMDHETLSRLESNLRNGYWSEGSDRAYAEAIGADYDEENLPF